MKPGISIFEIFGNGIKSLIRPDRDYWYGTAASASLLPKGKIIRRKTVNGKQVYLVEKG